LLLLGLSSLLLSYYNDNFYFHLATAKIQLVDRSNAATAVKTTLINNLQSLEEREGAPKVLTRNATLQTLQNNNSSSLPWPFQLSEDLSDSKNRLVVLIVSCPYMDFVDNLVESLKTLALTNYVVVPLDPLAENYAVQLLSKKHVVSVPPFVPTFNAQKAAKFNTRPFQKITSVRPKILHAFLLQGYTVFYNDVDVVWRHNILDMLDDHTDSDMIAMVDSHAVDEAYICSCYLYLRPTDTMKDFLQHWQALIDFDTKKKYKNDQEAIYDAYQAYGDKLSAKLYLSDNPFFPSGAVYDVWTSEPKSKAWLIHNNFIKGHDFKINRFLKWDLWKPSGQLDKMMWECGG
jgi:hypothetical protein